MHLTLTGVSAVELRPDEPLWPTVVAQCRRGSASGSERRCVCTELDPMRVHATMLSTFHHQGGRGIILVPKLVDAESHMSACTGGGWRRGACNSSARSGERHSLRIRQALQRVLTLEEAMAMATARSCRNVGQGVCAALTTGPPGGVWGSAQGMHSDAMVRTLLNHPRGPKSFMRHRQGAVSQRRRRGEVAAA